MKGLIIAALMLLPLTTIAKMTDAEMRQKIPMTKHVTKEDIWAWLGANQMAGLKLKHERDTGKRVPPTPHQKGRLISPALIEADLNEEDTATVTALLEKYSLWDFHERMCPLVEAREKDDINAAEIYSLLRTYFNDDKENRRQLYLELKHTLSRDGFRDLDNEIMLLLGTVYAPEPDRAVETLQGLAASEDVQKFMWQNDCYNRSSPPDYNDEFTTTGTN